MSSKDALDINPTVLLSDATLLALQLQHQPFGPLAPDSESFSDDTTAEQLADVKQALITGDDLLLILGDSGAGKTVLLRQLGENSGLRIQCFAVKGSSRFSTLNLFAGMLEAFKRPPPEKLKDILDELIPCLQTMVARNTLSAIVLDDAHLVTETELTQLLSGMLYVNSKDETLLRVALAAPPHFEDRIPDLLPEGADMPYSSLTIDGMDPTRAANYLTFRLEQNGFEGEWPFSERDMAHLVDQSVGLPGPLHAIAANALNDRFGPVERIQQPEDLITEPESPLAQSRMGKLIMGILATVFIAGGLIMFLPGKSDQDSENYTSSEPTPVFLDRKPAPDTLKLVESETKTINTAPLPGISLTGGLPLDNTSKPVDTLTSDNDTPEFPDQLAGTKIIIPESLRQKDTELSPSPETPKPAPNITTEVASKPVVIVATSETAASPDTTETQSTSTVVVSEVEQSQQTTNADATTTPTDPTADSASTTADDIDLELVGILESPTWILVQDRTKFTVQMSASRDQPSVENFLKRNSAALSAPNSIYTFERNGETWFALLHGLFGSIDEARSAVEGMPNSALTNQPWIRSVGRVQDVLRAQ